MFQLSNPIYAFYDSHFEEISFNAVGDDFILLMLLFSVNIYIYFSRNNFLRFWTLLSAGLASAVSLLTNLFTLGPEYTDYIGIISIFVLFILVIFILLLLSSREVMFQRQDNKLTKLLGIFGLVLCISSSIFVAQPQIKFFLSAAEGAIFKSSGTNTHTYVANSFSELGLVYKLLIALILILIFNMFIFQMLGFKVIPISIVILSMPILIKLVNDFISFGSSALTTNDGWDKESLDLYSPIKNVSGTIFYYGFLSSVILIIVITLISYVLDSNTKPTKESNSSNF